MARAALQARQTLVGSAGVLQASVLKSVSEGSASDRTLVKCPVWMVAIAETLTEPAAVALFVNLKTSRPLLATLAELYVFQLVLLFCSLPVTLREKWGYPFLSC